MKNLINFLNELSQTELKLSTRAGAPIISTTQRSAIKQGIMDALAKDIEMAVEQATNEEYLNADTIIGFTADGLVVALAHEQLERKRLNEIPFKIEVKVANLDYDTTHEIEAYYLEQQEKIEKKAQKEKSKKEKIERDKERRESQLKAKGYETE